MSQTSQICNQSERDEWDRIECSHHREQNVTDDPLSQGDRVRFGEVGPNDIVRWGSEGKGYTLDSSSVQLLSHEVRVGNSGKGSKTVAIRNCVLIVNLISRRFRVVGARWRTRQQGKG